MSTPAACALAVVGVVGQLWGVAAFAQATGDGSVAAWQDRCRREDFTVAVGGREFPVIALSPPGGMLAEDPCLLLTFGADRSSAMFSEPYSLSPKVFLERGHRALTFDMPAHGDRVDQYGGSIPGWLNAFLAGVDPFAMFVEDGKAVINECVRRGWARPGRIAVAGASRCGYAALRLLAADDRIAAGAGLAPVTDWRYLDEFEAVRERKDVAKLRLSQFAGGMVGKRVYLAIGDDDDRVSTSACVRLARTLQRANAKADFDASHVELHVTHDLGHRLGDPSYAEGAESVLDWMTRTSRERREASGT